MTIVIPPKIIEISTGLTDVSKNLLTPSAKGENWVEEKYCGKKKCPNNRDNHSFDKVIGLLHCPKVF